MVIDFTATWCGPCRFMEPTLNELAETYTDVVFVKIDVDELRVLWHSTHYSCDWSLICTELIGPGLSITQDQIMVHELILTQRSLGELP